MSLARRSPTNAVILYNASLGDAGALNGSPTHTVHCPFHCFRLHISWGGPSELGTAFVTVRMIENVCQECGWGPVSLTEMERRHWMRLIADLYQHAARMHEGLAGCIDERKKHVINCMILDARLYNVSKSIPRSLLNQETLDLTRSKAPQMAPLSFFAIIE